MSGGSCRQDEKGPDTAYRGPKSKTVKVLLGSGFFGRSFLGGILGGFGGSSGCDAGFSTLGCLGAGNSAFRVVAGFALEQACGIEETQHAVGRLGAHFEPMLGALSVQHDADFIVLGEQRIEGA